MGSAQVNEDEDEALLDNFKSEIEPLTLGEQLDEWCAYYMSIGVPYETFWYGDPCCLKYYVDTYRLKKKQNNEYLWLQGMYNLEAFSVTLANGFRDKKSGKTYRYSDKPYDVVPLTEREQAIANENKKKQIIRTLNNLKSAWERKHGGKQDEDS